MDITTRSMQANRNLESWLFAVGFGVIVVLGFIVPDWLTVVIGAGIFGMFLLACLYRFVLEPIYTDWVLDREIARELTPEEKVQVDEHLLERGLPPKYGGEPD